MYFSDAEHPEVLPAASVALARNWVADLASHRWASFGADFGVRIRATRTNIAWLSLIASEFPIPGSRR
jgi:hypothetical protein